MRVNVAVFVLMTTLGGNPYRATGPVLEQGALFGPLVRERRVVATRQRQALLHSGVLHLGMNMLLLWFLSQEAASPALGRLRTPHALRHCVARRIPRSAAGRPACTDRRRLGHGGAWRSHRCAHRVAAAAKQNPWQSGIGGVVLVLNLVLTVHARGSRSWSRGRATSPEPLRCSSRSGGLRRGRPCARPWWSASVLRSPSSQSLLQRLCDPHVLLTPDL